MSCVNGRDLAWFGGAAEWYSSGCVGECAGEGDEKSGYGSGGMVTETKSSGGDWCVGDDV